MGAVNRKNISCILLSIGLLSFTRVSLANSTAIVFIIIAVFLQLPEIARIIKARNVGQRVFLLSMAIIILSAGAHFLYNPSKASLTGLSVVSVFPLLYLLARVLGPKLLLMFTVGGITESIAMLASLPGGRPEHLGVIFGIAHFSSFIITLGIILSPGRLKWPALLLGIPAIMTTGSEEGALLLFILAICMCARADMSRRGACAGALLLLILLTIVLSGYFSNMHPGDYTLDRFSSPGDITHHRTTAYNRVLPDIWLGTGWYWNTAGGINQTIHNAPLKAAEQFGILAGAAWFTMVIYGIARTRYRYTFMILFTAAMVDHYLFSYLIFLPPVIFGAISAADPGTSDRLFTKTGALSVIKQITGRLSGDNSHYQTETGRYGYPRKD